MKKLSLYLILICTVLLVSCAQADTSNVSDGVSTTELYSEATTQSPDNTEPDRGADTTDDKKPSAGLKDYDINELSFGALDPTQLSQLYEKARRAEADGAYQYAHALYALLARKGYSDSADKERELIASANATPIIYTSSVHIGEINVDGEHDGYLYIGEGGVPRFAYIDGAEIKEAVPDASIDGVISITDHDIYGAVGMTNVYQCLRRDGTVALIYRLPNENSPAFSASSEGVSKLDVFTRTLGDVVKIVASKDSYVSAYLHKDGSVSVFMPSGAADTSAIKNAVDICIYSKGVAVLGSDGRLSLLELWESSYPNEKEYDGEESIQLFGEYDIYDGVVYAAGEDRPLEYYTKNDYSDHEYYSRVVLCGVGYCVDADGAITVSVPTYDTRSVLGKNASGISYVIRLGGLLFSVDTEGKIAVDESYFESYAVTRVLTHITVDIRTKV